MPTREGSPDILMVWPRQAAVPTLPLASGYHIEVLAADRDADWIAIHREAIPTFGAAQLEEWLANYRKLALPDGILVAIETATGTPVATAGSIANSKQGMFPDGGQLAWVATVPDHRGRGLGSALSTTTTARLLRDGFRRVFLCTGDDLTDAIRIYLRLGYLPCLYAADQPRRWESICTVIGAPFEPGGWPDLQEYVDDFS